MFSRKKLDFKIIYIHIFVHKFSNNALITLNNGELTFDKVRWRSVTPWVLFGNGAGT
jgi:hypothetical protein